MSIKEMAMGGMETILEQARNATRYSDVTYYYMEICGYMKCIMDVGVMDEIEVGEQLVYINNEFSNIRKGWNK